MGGGGNKITKYSKGACIPDFCKRIKRAGGWNEKKGRGKTREREKTWGISSTEFIAKNLKQISSADFIAKNLKKISSADFIDKKLKNISNNDQISLKKICQKFLVLNSLKK